MQGGQARVSEISNIINSQFGLAQKSYVSFHHYNKNLILQFSALWTG